MRFVTMAIPRTEVVLHRILRGQKRLSVLRGSTRDRGTYYNLESLYY
jgi:hypothetical protein